MAETCSLLSIEYLWYKKPSFVVFTTEYTFVVFTTEYTFVVFTTEFTFVVFTTGYTFANCTFWSMNIIFQNNRCWMGNRRKQKTVCNRSQFLYIPLRGIYTYHWYLNGQYIDGHNFLCNAKYLVQRKTFISRCGNTVRNTCIGDLSSTVRDDVSRLLITLDGL
jgi:hypothetical protein